MRSEGTFAEALFAARDHYGQVDLRSTCDPAAPRTLPPTYVNDSAPQFLAS
jgi:hypothetical protein